MWTKEDDEEMVIEKMEAQAWICLYNLLSTREVAAFLCKTCNTFPSKKYIDVFMSTQGDGEISTQ